MKKKSSGIFALTLLLAACSTGPSATQTALEPKSDKEACARMAEMHTQQKAAHEAAAKIDDPTMQPGLQRMLDGMDLTIAGAEKRVAAQGIRCN